MISGHGGSFVWEYYIAGETGRHSEGKTEKAKEYLY